MSKYIKTNRIFSPVRKYAWLFTLLVAIGGLWEPKLGLLVILIMVSLTVSAFFTGRHWCGNVCPHGSLFDKIFLPISLNKRIPGILKSKYFITGFFLFFMYNFSKRMLLTFEFWGTYDFLDKLGFVFVMTYFVVFVIGGVMAILITPRTWCQFCPMGTIQKVVHSLGRLTGITERTEKKVTITNKEECLNCGKCARVCPFQLEPYLDFSEDNNFDNINCIKCSACVKSCPVGVLSLENKKPA